MFNSLKEMQESLPYDDLCKYANESLGKTVEEIKTILKSHNVEVSDSTAIECYEFIKGIRAIDNEELENVTGGSCYSSETFDDLGIYSKYSNGQQRHYHPLITTIGNHCNLIEGGSTCLNCENVDRSGAGTFYCGARSRECDPAK